MARLTFFRNLNGSFSRRRPIRYRREFRSFLKSRGYSNRRIRKLESGR